MKKKEEERNLLLHLYSGTRVWECLMFHFPSLFSFLWLLVKVKDWVVGTEAQVPSAPNELRN
jgi:hypothetical protein